MRITFVVPEIGWLGGMRVIAFYAQALHALGHRVQVVSVPRRSVPLRRKIKRWVTGHGWPATPQPTLGHFTGTPVPCRVLPERRPVTDADVPDADVVIATWWETAEWVLRLSRHKGAKVYLVQGHETVVYDDDPETIARIEATYRSGMYCLTVSRWLEELLRTQYDCVDVAMVSNGVDVSQFFTAPRDKRSQPTVGFVYSDAPMKGASRCADAIERTRRVLPNLAVHAFGAHMPDVGALPPGTDYVLSPPQILIPHLYGSCDAWLLASRHEGFGLPLLEAMACRTPFVAMETGAAPELAQAGGGCVVPEGDTAAMAEQLVHLLQLDDEAWRLRSEAARAVAVEHRWETRVPRFEQALEDAIAAQRPITGSLSRPRVVSTVIQDQGSSQEYETADQDE